MKIGILTFHRAINYGAFLQCFATKKHLEDNGYDVEVIDYWPIEHENTYKPISLSYFTIYKHNILYAVKQCLNSLICFQRADKRFKKMRKLVQQYFHLSENALFHDSKELSSLNYDAVIYGSDQVWWKSTIINYEGFDDVYWGDVIPCKRKVAYAASMGALDINDIDKKYIRDHLLNFSSIAVREIELRNLLDSISNKEINVVLDPVFLLDKKKWESYLPNMPKNTEPYLLYYNLMKSSEADRFVNSISKKLGLKIIEVTGRVEPFKISSKYVQTADAFEFLSYIKNASYVVSTSFHGTAFSIIFNKQFSALGMGKKSGRVNSLLLQLNIADRLVKDATSINHMPIDYSLVNALLEDLKKKSKHYLDIALNE